MADVHDDGQAEPRTREERAGALADDVTEWAAANPNAGEVLFLLGRCCAALREAASETITVGEEEPICDPEGFIEVLGRAIEEGKLSGIEGLRDEGTASPAGAIVYLELDGGETRIPITVGAREEVPRG